MSAVLVRSGAEPRDRLATVSSTAAWLPSTSVSSSRKAAAPAPFRPSP